MSRMRSLADVRAVFELKARGFTDREVAAHTGVPINTIRLWRNRSVPLCARPAIVSEQSVRNDRPPDVRSLPAHAYAYLLGMYLGDGCLARNGSSWTLRITLDEAYPGTIAECEAAVERIARGRRVYTRPASGGQHCVNVACTWHPWVVLFPQHGRGLKHHRRIGPPIGSRTSSIARRSSSFKGSFRPTAGGASTAFTPRAGTTRIRATSSPTGPTTSASSLPISATSSASNGGGGRGITYPWHVASR
jgi:hypothetical protein